MDIANGLVGMIPGRPADTALGLPAVQCRPFCGKAPGNYRGLLPGEYDISPDAMGFRQYMITAVAWGNGKRGTAAVDRKVLAENVD